ncbi:MAG: hypothetical protein FK731_03555 [Asgard group archaeon]|nr:hypothetical protein [Asgard group archaeon]
MKTTIFCPSCGTANRDDAEMCSECGSVIPKLADDSGSNSSNSKASLDFGIMQTPKEPSPNDFGIDISPPPPPPPPPDSNQQSAYSTGYAPYDSPYPTSGQKQVCERCGTVLRPDDTQCPGCGKPHHTSVRTPPPPNYKSQAAPYSPSQPYSPPSPYTPTTSSVSSPYPSQQTTSTPNDSKIKEQPTQKIAKCARCGAIVYDYEARCNNCGRILAPPSTQVKDKPVEQVKVPAGAARCGRCNAIVYPHQTVCPNCGKPLAPIEPARGPSQRISRCKRCGHTVYPTDTRCSNCGRKLDSV